MNKSRVTLSAIITLIGAIAFGFISFLGNMYLKSGEYFNSIIYPVLFTLGLIILALVASKFKKKKFFFQKNAIKELLFVFIYLFLAIISMVSFTHFFTIQDRKNEISLKIERDIENVKKMFPKYEESVNERIDGFDGFLDATIAGKATNQTMYIKYFVIGGPDEIFQKNNKLNQFQDDLKPNEYDTMKQLALDWLNKSQHIILSLKPIGLMEVINSFETNSKEWYSKIQKYDKTINTFQDEGNNTPFTYNLSFSSVNEELTTIKKPDFISLGILIVVHIFILFIYILAIRDGKSPGLFTALLSKDNDSGSDL